MRFTCTRLFGTVTEREHVSPAPRYSKLVEIAASQFDLPAQCLAFSLCGGSDTPNKDDDDNNQANNSFRITQNKQQQQRITCDEDLAEALLLFSRSRSDDDKAGTLKIVVDVVLATVIRMCYPTVGTFLTL